MDWPARRPWLSATGGFTLGLLWLTFAMVPSASAATPVPRLHVVMSANDGIYQDFYQAFQQTLTRLWNQPIHMTVSASVDATLASDFWVAVGTQACQALLKRKLTTPGLCTLTPRLAVEPWLAKHASPATAIYLDQPLARQLALLRLVLPEVRHIGFLYGPVSAPITPALQTLADAQHLQLHSLALQPDGNIVDVLERLLDDIDVLLAIPDPVVFSRGNIYPLLLATYRQQVPVIGFSDSYVKAGALAAVFSTPAQLGRQTAEMLAAVLGKEHNVLPPPQYPRYFTVRVNRQVAKSLRLSVPSETALQRELMTADEARYPQ